MKKLIALAIMTLLISITFLPITGAIRIGTDAEEYFEESNNPLNNNFYICNYENWKEHIKLTASDEAETDYFGGSVSIDGDYAIVGAINNDNWKGAAYIFRRDGDDWIEEQKLVASDAEDSPEEYWDWFGNSVAIDGEYAVVGAEYDDNENSPDRSPTWKAAGAAYIFKRHGNYWIEEQKLIASDGYYWDRFGSSVAIEGDTILIGAVGDHNDNCNEPNEPYTAPGSVYVFNKVGELWIEEQKLVASDLGCIDDFGCSIDIHGDYTIIGAFGADENLGAAYIFKRDDNVWFEEYKLTAGDRQTWSSFGGDVSINGDYALVGARNIDNDEGAVYAFRNNAPNWPQVQKIKASDAGASGGGRTWGRFGWSVDMDGDTAIIGSRFHNEWRGAAYIFKLEDGFWVEEQKIAASDGEIADYFGTSVSIDGDYTIIGAVHDSSVYNVRSGSAYIFKKMESGEPEIPTISGPNSGQPYEEYEFTFSTTDPYNDFIYYWIEWGDGTKEQNGWIGPYSSGEQIILYHTWGEEGPYEIKAKAKNTNDLESGWAYLNILIDSNAPRTPDITGPNDVATGEEWDYRFVTLDPNDEDVYYWIEWGDGTTEEDGWIGPYESGVQIAIGHTWDYEGEYEIKAKAKNTNDYESGWGYYKVTMPRDKAIISPYFQKLSNIFTILKQMFRI